MDRGNLIGLGVVAVAAVALVAVANPAYDALEQSRLENAAGGEEIVTATGEGEGYGGTITVEVTMAGDRILDLQLTGADETPEIGGAAITALQDEILEKQSLDGVAAVSGATWTSDGVFDAIRSAMGEEVGGEDETAVQEEVQTAGLTLSLIHI